MWRLGIGGRFWRRREGVSYRGGVIERHLCRFYRWDHYRGNMSVRISVVLIAGECIDCSSSPNVFICGSCSAYSLAFLCSRPRPKRSALLFRSIKSDFRLSEEYVGILLFLMDQK
jgi:hypothetical protein